ncbi:MAG TPA: ABC transporter ATP-binding protein [Thermomicrobiales bacterium]|jgi:ABC-2 type transport system ATP-binding protein|nr:ABC transporter ATP-binding protein [Thermomicrobiales bacterium]
MVSSLQPPIIDIHGLVKRYDSFTAVDGIDLSVEYGEIYGILGPNGAGKTTTLEMIEGLRMPDSGSITVDGIDAVRESDRVRPIIGVQLQTTALFEYLSAAELVTLFAGLYESDASPAKVQRLLDMVDLREKAGSQVNTLSGGQRQRLSIALALVNDPRVVFLDEPTTGLDPGARRDLWQMIRGIRADGTTVVLTTHYMEEAEVLCDRVAVMDRGRVIACDTPAALIASLGIEATVRARITGGSLELVELQSLPAVLSATIEDDRIALQTRDVQTTLIALLRLVEARGVTLAEMTSQQSTLEDVFLSLTGRTYDDTADEPAKEAETVAAGGRRRRRQE